MKIALFGGSGQLGFELIKRAGDLNFEIVAPVKKEVDIKSRDDVFSFLARVKPDVVVNSAAYTAVDKAESDSDNAFLVNRDAARFIAEAVRNEGAKLLHVSTDYVFDGQISGRSLDESAETNPINVYGKSKLAGEQEVLRILAEKGLVLRTSSLHGQRGVNFVHTMIDLLCSKEKVSVVNDQFMCPTWAGWLAEVILDLIRSDASGILHACGSGVTSWYGFAEEISKVLQKNNRKVADIEAVSAANFPRPAKRPAYSALNCDKLKKTLGRANMSWRDGLGQHFKDLGFKHL
jgi:dTDP-4-dehydrorhamnose reductase